MHPAASPLLVSLLLALAGGLAGPAEATAQPAPTVHRPSGPASSLHLPVRLVPDRPARSVRPQPADRWFARDKLKHLTFSFLWTLSAQYVLVDKVGWSNRAALPAAAGSSAAVGLSKEVFDWTIGPTRRFSTRDLAADAVGIALALGVIVL